VKESLERKFGRQCHQIALNLKEVDRSGELDDGLLCMKLQKKIPAKMLANYHRWIFEKQKGETLREWVIQETEFQTRALEAAHGLPTSRPGKFDLKKFKKETTHSYFGRSQTKSDVGTQRPYLQSV